LRENPIRMSTATATQIDRLNGKLKHPAEMEPPIEHVVIGAVDWDFYEGLLALIGDRHSPRITYDRGKLEIMAPSWNHEWWAARLDRIILGVSEVLDVPLISGGSTTFRREDLERGLEPDKCYYTINAQRMLGPRELDLSVDPPPDLAIEVDFTSRSIDRLGIYAALGVPEVWRWDAGGIHAYHLQRTTELPGYAEAGQSLSFPTVPMDRVVDFVIVNQTLSDLQLIRAARDWATAGFPPAGDDSPT
jgi:Uma2 family endonuclease